MQLFTLPGFYSLGHVHISSHLAQLLHKVRLITVTKTVGCIHFTPWDFRLCCSHFEAY